MLPIEKLEYVDKGMSVSCSCTSKLGLCFVNAVQYVLGRGWPCNDTTPSLYSH